MVLPDAGLADDRGRGARGDRRRRRRGAPSRPRRSGTDAARGARRRGSRRARACPPRCRPGGRGTRRCGRRAPASSARRPRSLSRLPIGANSRVCRVVNATSVPIVDRAPARVGEAGEPVDRGRHDRERHLDRLPSSSGRSCGSAPRARRGASTHPRSARRARPSGPSSCRAGCPTRTATPGRATRCPPSTPAARVAIRAPLLADLRVIQTNSGISASANSASRQSSRNIAMTVAITVVTVDMTEVAVEVRTLSTPPMSLRSGSAPRRCASS